MRRACTTVLALAAGLTLGACNGTPAASPTTAASSVVATDAATGTATTQPTTTTSTPTATTPGATALPPTPAVTGTTPAPTTTAASTTTTAPPDQSTPEKAMLAYMAAMMRGDATTVCQLNVHVAQQTDALQLCVDSLKGQLDQLTKVADQFRGLNVTGATVSGTTATFDQATVTPPLAESVVRQFQATKIGDKWFIDRK